MRTSPKGRGRVGSTKPPTPGMSWGARQGSCGDVQSVLCAMVCVWVERDRVAHTL